MFVDVPEGMGWSEPSSPAALHIRMQAIARFHSDPERYILRHAARIQATESELCEALPPRSGGSGPKGRWGRVTAAARSSSSSIENGSAGYYYAVLIRGPPRWSFHWMHRTT